VGGAEAADGGFGPAQLEPMHITAASVARTRPARPRSRADLPFKVLGFATSAALKKPRRATVVRADIAGRAPGGRACERDGTDRRQDTKSMLIKFRTLSRPRLRHLTF